MKPLSSLTLPLIIALLPAAARAYDPMAATSVGEVQEFTVVDTARQREIPLRVYLPAPSKAAPVLLFSHGLGGSRNGSAYLGQHWAARGYVAVFLQHPGSDEALWKDAPPAERMASLKAGANSQQFLHRVKDVPAVLDALAKWNTQESHPLRDRLDLNQVGMSGHSFGAITTQAVSGQSAAGKPRFTDARIKAALPMSPSPPPRESADRAFGSVSIPWLLMTGTKDTAIVADFTPEQRRQVFPALPPGGNYELVLEGAEHSAFTERALPGDREPRNPNHHRAILALSTAFWDTYLKQDSDAKAWLDGEGAQSVLEPADAWRRK